MQTAVILLILAVLAGLGFYFATRNGVVPAPEPPGPEPPTPGIGTELIVTAPTSAKAGDAVTVTVELINKLELRIYASVVGVTPLQFDSAIRAITLGASSSWLATFTMPNTDVNYAIESWFESLEHEWHKDAVATGVIIATELPPEPPPGPPEPSQRLKDLFSDLAGAIYNVDHGNGNVEDTWVNLGNVVLTNSEAVPRLREAMIVEALAINLITQEEAAGIYWDGRRMYRPDGTRVI